MLERDRRSVIKGAAVALLSVGTVSAASGSEDDNDMRTLHWDNQDNKPTTQNCAENETAYWHWVLTPGGSEPIKEGAKLQVFFKDNSSDSDEGEPRGEGQGAVHFTVSKEGGGTVESATVSFEGGGDEARLVLRNRWCKAGAEEGDETEDDGGKPDEGDDETGDGSDEPGEDSEQEPSEEDGDDPDEEKDTEDDENGADEDETSDDGGTGDDSEQDPGEEDGGDPDEEENADDDVNEADEGETGDDATDDADGTDDNTNGTDEDSDEENPSDADGEDDGESEYGGDETGSGGSDETHHC